MNKVAKNVTWILACRIVQAILALIINMLTARYLGPSNFGLITYAASLVAFVLPVVQLGFNSILVQEIVNNPDREGTTIGTSMTLSLFSSLACVIGVTSFSAIANHNETVTILVCLLYSVNLIFQALELIQFWFQAKYLSKYTSIVSLCAYTIVSIYKIFLLITEKNVYWFAISHAFDYALIALGITIIYFKLGGQKLSFSWDVARHMFSRSKHYILSGMMVTVFAQTDKIMIKLMIDETATGYYGAAVATAGLTSFVFTAIIDSFRPYIFEGKNGSEQLFQHRLSMLYSIVIYLSLCQSVFMTIFSKFIIHILYGDAYASSVLALQLVVWYTTFSYVGAVRDVWILSHNKQHILWKINLIGAFTNVVLNLLLIRIFGFYGAAIASVLTQFFTNVVLGFLIREIRPNNYLLVKATSPRLLIEAVTRISKRK